MSYLLTLFLCVLLSLSPNASAGKIYTWLDSDNVRHFSDIPPPESIQNDELTMPTLPTITPLVIPKKERHTPTALTDDNQSFDSLAPQQVTLINLANDQTIRNNQGNFTIKVELTRKAHIGEQLQLLLDGTNYNAPQTQTQWQLKNIDRGTHTLQIQVVKSGKVIALSDLTTVHLHRTSRNNRG